MTLTKVKRIRFLLIGILSIAVLAVKGQNASEIEAYKRGNEACPCLTNETISSLSAEDLSESLLAALGSVDPYTYGVGCGTHDSGTAACTGGACTLDPNLAPQPVACDNSYCQRAFCYVDPKKCSLLSRRSDFFPDADRFYSYATCWEVDFFVSTARIQALDNKTFKVGFNSNSGGWVGAYRDPSMHFEGPLSSWSGPAVSMALEGAARAGFQIKLTVPPPFLKNGSLVYFGTSSFDLCVYATSLGYLDFCLAQYTITDKRAATTDWLLLNSQDLNLIVQLQKELSAWDGFKESLSLVFAPFKVQTWLFIVFFVVPFLGALMVIHEYNHPGSSYPETHNVIVRDNDDRGMESVEERRVPYYQHVSRAIYINILSVLQQNYVHTVVSYGAMMNLLGISFFILTIIAVYTANLAAILTQQAQKTSVSSLTEALRANYRICSERKNLETVRALYPEIEDRHLVVDPFELGGDGLPGFTCSNCSARTRVFDFLDLSKANSGDPSYCHAAFAPLEDLEVENRKGNHCDKTPVGVRIGQVQTGIPIYQGVSKELISFFLKLKNDGVYDRLIKQAQPTKNCPLIDSGEEGSALSIAQLTGIWIVSFGFAFVGLLITFVQPNIEKRSKQIIKPVHQFDQTGHRINVLDKDDDWMKSQSIVRGDKRVFIGDARWSKAVLKYGSGSVAQSTFKISETPRKLSGPGMRLRSLSSSSSAQGIGVRSSSTKGRGILSSSFMSDQIVIQSAHSMNSVDEEEESVKSYSGDDVDDRHNYTEATACPPSLPYQPLPPIALPAGKAEYEKMDANAGDERALVLVDGKVAALDDYRSSLQQMQPRSFISRTSD